MANNFIPTGWVRLTITKKASRIADNGTLELAIAGLRGGHPIELLPESNALPWGSQEDNLYSYVQLPCQVEVKGRLLIGDEDDGGEGVQGRAGMSIVVEKWRSIKASDGSNPSKDAQDKLEQHENDNERNNMDRYGKTSASKRPIVMPASSKASSSKRPRSSSPATSPPSPPSTPSPPPTPSHLSTPSHLQQRPYPPISVFQPQQSILPSFLPHTIRPRPSRLRVTDVYFFDGRGYCRPPQEDSGAAAYPRNFDGLFVFEQEFSDGQRRVIRIAANAQETEGVNSLVVYEDWR
ncbi:MAG: hypothetical protein J3R72DRAFT_497352 [Linnemannia gamsii]|nr:MAG: hypothetical protein J3R72DRAFT_497352 [Linnemannia gamsii]